MKADLETGRTEASEESTSLLGKSSARLSAALSGPLTSPRVLVEGALKDAVPILKEDQVVTKYDPIELTRVSTLFIFKGTIFGQPSMWYVLLLAFAIVGFLAVGVYKLIERFDQYDPESFSTETIGSVIRSVTVAMAFLLGLYVNNAMSRWWDIIKAFESLFGAVKKLVGMLIALDVSPQCREEVARRCLLSIEMLRFEQIESKLHGNPEDNWKELFDELMKDGALSKQERESLEMVSPQDRSFTTWTLVSKSIKAQKEQIKDTFKTVLKIVQEGTSAVSQLKSVANFQFPYLYTHMLAWMVHLVNILTAVCSGITIGIVVARAHQSKKNSAGYRQPIDVSAIFKELLFLFIQVFLYQAFLAIGAALSYPIVPKGHGAMYRMPLQEMIAGLRKTLVKLNELADRKVL